MTIALEFIFVFFVVKASTRKKKLFSKKSPLRRTPCSSFLLYSCVLTRTRLSLFSL